MHSTVQNMMIEPIQNVRGLTIHCRQISVERLNIDMHVDFGAPTAKAAHLIGSHQMGMFC